MLNCCHFANEFYNFFISIILIMNSDLLLLLQYGWQVKTLMLFKIQDTQHNKQFPQSQSDGPMNLN